MLPERFDEGLNLYRPALILDGLLSRRVRRTVGGVSFFLTLFFIAILVVGVFIPEVGDFGGFVFGLVAVSSGVWLIFSLLSAFYNSHYFRDLGTPVTARAQRPRAVPLSYAVAEIVFHGDTGDSVLSFLRSRFGINVLMRLGIASTVAVNFLNSRTALTPLDALHFEEGGSIDAVAYAHALYAADSGFAQFLFSNEVQEEDFMGAVSWLADSDEKAKRIERWWSRESLGRIPGLGKSWAYGQTAHLERYAEELLHGAPPTDSGTVKEVEELEAILTRAQGANALIIGEAGGGGMDIVLGLVGMIRRGTAFPELEGKRIFRFDTIALVDAFVGRAGFENEFIGVMNEAVKAGNVIVVFDDLPAFIESAAQIGSDATQLLAPYLESSRAQIIAFSDTMRFHESIERRAALVNAFEVVRVEEKGGEALVSVLQAMVPTLEARTGVFFTHQAVKAVAASAVRFFMDGNPLDKARDLMTEVPALVAARGGGMVKKDDVLSLVESKTGVPQEGRMKEEEKDKLLNLEKLLHERVVGQDEAINAVSNAMRRARAGLRNTERPIGSFLFLGPTGVGKTETAKALNDIFFGANAQMLRLDMSEYSGYDALSRLIGSANGQVGVLASMLRDQKYGVLLLDEFEKTTPEVMNLFLQVLDEGFFSDALGKKVNARNVIVIATSNAGAEEIFKFTEAGKDLTSAKDAFTDMLVSRGLFKPELLNRFDGVILFHPLVQNDLREIANLVIDKLAAQLKNQGLKLVPTDDLAEYLSEKGFDPKFGARPMNRVLQEKVEKLVADKMIRGELQRGASISLVRSTSEPGELEVVQVG